MNILLIWIKNFVLFFGEYLIDFESDFFVSVGLIVIVGKIGVGKFIILDVMCLVLFNCILWLKDSDGKF